jgi:LPXTG-site transpeptidase (sortase) family protein
MKHRNAFVTVLVVLGATLLTIGLVKGYFDLQASPAAALNPPNFGGEADGRGAATTTRPSATPVPPTATPAIAPPTLRPSPSPTLRRSSGQGSGGTSLQASAATPTPTLTHTPTPALTPTPPGPPPASAPPDRIVIPAIGLDAPVVPVGWTVTDEGAVWDAADYAAGWHQGSAYPGHVGNTVLSGHHNIKGKVFRYLIDLQPDDEVFLYVGETAYRYVVTEKHIFEEKGKPEAVRRANAQWIAPTDDERLTLVTCWPYTSNTHRLIVVAKPSWKLKAGSRLPVTVVWHSASSFQQ